MFKKKYFFVSFALIFSNNLEASLYNREFKTINMKFENIKDKYIYINEELKNKLFKIDKYLENKKYLDAKELIKKTSKNININSYIKSLLINKYSLVIEALSNTKEAIKYLEKNIEEGNINEKVIEDSYFLLLKFNNKLDNSSKVNLYSDIIKKVYINNKKLQLYTDIEIAKYYIKRKHFSKSKSILENVLFNTNDPKISALASIILSNIIFKEGINTDRIEIILRNIFDYNKKFFIINKKLLLDNLNFLEKNIHKSKIIRDIFEYMYFNIPIENNKNDLIKLGLTLYKVYLKRKELLKAKKIILDMTTRYDLIEEKDLYNYLIKLDYIYSMLEIIRYNEVINKYDFKNIKNNFKVIFMNNYIKNKDIFNILMLYKDIKNIPEKNFNNFYYVKKDIISKAQYLLYKYFFIDNNNKEDINFKILLELINIYMSRYQDTFPVNNNVVMYLLSKKYSFLNDKLFKLYKKNYNIILNMSLIKLFAYSNINYSLEYIDKILNKSDIRMNEKKDFYIAKMNILLSLEDMKKIAKELEYIDIYELNNIEKKKILYNFYLLLKNYSIDYDYLEKILFDILNLSGGDLLYRPFIDFELIILLNEKEEFEKSLLLLKNIPKQIYLNKEKKAKLFYLFSKTYEGLQDFKNKNKFLNKCISINEDNIWVQNCKFLKNI